MRRYIQAALLAGCHAQRRGRTNLMSPIRRSTPSRELGSSSKAATRPRKPSASHPRWKPPLPVGWTSSRSRSRSAEVSWTMRYMSGNALMAAPAQVVAEERECEGDRASLGSIQQALLNQPKDCPLHRSVGDRELAYH